MVHGVHRFPQEMSQDDVRQQLRTLPSNASLLQQHMNWPFGGLATPGPPTEMGGYLMCTWGWIPQQRNPG